MNLNEKYKELYNQQKLLLNEKQLFNNKINLDISKLENDLSEISAKIREIQKPKFITDIRYADFVCVLMNDSTKKITRDYFDLNIERELNSDEYYEYVQELGFVEGCKISHWDNGPLTLTKLVKGYSGYAQPFFWRNTSPTKHYPNGSVSQFYNHKLVVENPTEFWHYKFKR